MESKGQDFTQLSDTKWLCDLALLVDVNTCLSDLNLKLQGHGKLISTLFDNVKPSREHLNCCRDSSNREF